MLSVIYKPFCAECHYAECRYAKCCYAECHYAKCRYAECRYADCHYAECRSAIVKAQSLLRGTSKVKKISLSTPPPG